MILFFLACTGENKDNSVEEETQTFTDFRVVQADYEYLSDGVQKEGQQLYTYETDNRFYSELELTEITAGETTLKQETSILNSAGYWDSISQKIDEEFYATIGNYDYDQYSNIIYYEETGTIEGFDDEEDVTYRELEREYKSHDIKIRQEERVYREIGTPRKISTSNYPLAEFNPCPDSPFLSFTSYEEFNAQGELTSDRGYEFDTNGYPTRGYSTTGGWSSLFQFELDEQGKPVRQTVTDEETDLPNYMYEFSYNANKLYEIISTNYDENGEISAQYKYTLNFEPTPWDNAFRNGYCSWTKQDMDGNHQWDYWKPELWTIGARRFTQFSTEGEEIGYWLQEIETYSFEVTE